MDNSIYQNEQKRKALNNTIIESVAEDIDKDYQDIKEQMKSWNPTDQVIVTKYFNSYNAFFLRHALDEFIKQKFELFNKTFNDPYLKILPEGLRYFSTKIIEECIALNDLNKEFTPESIKIDVDNYISAKYKSGEFVRIKRGEYHYTPPFAKILTVEFIKNKIEELVDELSEVNLNLKDTQENIINTSYKYQVVMNELSKLKTFLN